MQLAIALLAALSTAPTSPNLSGLFTPDDVPIDILPVPFAGFVGIRLTVQPDGKVQDCAIEKSSGIRELDNQTCGIATKRAKFPPPIGSAGTPVYAIYRSDIVYAVSESPTQPHLHIGDFYLPVVRLPQGLKDPVQLRIKFDVDPQGHAANCEDEAAPGRDAHDPQLIAAACAKLQTAYTPVVAKDEAGRPVPSIQDATVAVIVQ